MGSIQTNAKVKRATVHAVITRADGTVEDLGMIAEWLPLHTRVLRAITKFFTPKCATQVKKVEVVNCDPNSCSGEVDGCSRDIHE